MVDITKVLADHALWLAEKGGTRAYLTGANLTGAKLSGAKLTGARGIVDAGSRSDGYRFIGVITEAGVIIKAGCRYFSPEDAREHWGATRPGTQLGRESVALVFHI